MIIITDSPSKMERGIRKNDKKRHHCQQQQRRRSTLIIIFLLLQPCSFSSFHSFFERLLLLYYKYNSLTATTTTASHFYAFALDNNNNNNNNNDDPTSKKRFHNPLQKRTRSKNKNSNSTSASTAIIMTQEETKAPAPKPDSALKSFLSGGVGGVCAVLVGHPFDLVKVRMQTSAATTGLGNASVFGILRKTFVTDGMLGLYRGVSAPIVATAPMFAVSFWGYDIGKRIVRSMDKEFDGQGQSGGAGGDYKFTIPQLCAAGAISALPTTLIMAPSERLKCLLQVQANEIEKGGKAKYKGLADCAMKVYQEGGIRSVFKGTGATLLRDVPGTIAWYGTYEIAKKALMKIQNVDPESGQLSLSSIVVAGGFAGINCWIISVPPDVLKSRFQTAPPGRYNGIADVYRELMKKEGPAALFSGIRPALIRAFPANAACFLGMEVSRSLMTFLD